MWGADGCGKGGGGGGRTLNVTSEASSIVSPVPASRIAAAKAEALSTEIVVGTRHSVEPGAETVPGSQGRQEPRVPSVPES